MRPTRRGEYVGSRVGATNSRERVVAMLALFVVAVSQARAVSVRLRGSATPWDGRVEVLHEKEWGSVCDAGWDLTDANVSTTYDAGPRVNHFNRG